MKFSLKPIEAQVIVITGASSGIGLATAVRAARQGARVVLAARNPDGLAKAERRLAADGRVATVTADVGLRTDVERIVEAAQSRFGGFDTWVNNAGVTLWGRLDEVPEEDHRRLFETNFWGMVHGTLAA